MTMKLRNKITIFFIWIVVVSLIIIMPYTFFTIKQNNKRCIDNLSTQLFTAIANEADLWLANKIHDIRIIAQEDCVKEMDIVKIRTYVDSINQTIGQEYGNSWGTFAIGDSSGIGWVKEDMYIDISERSYFLDSAELEQELILVPPVSSKTDGSLISIIHYPLINETGYYGFINAAINLDALTALMEKIDFYDGVSWIMNSEHINYTKSTIPADFQLDKIHLSENANQLSYGPYTLFYQKINSVNDLYLCTLIKTNALSADTYRLLTNLLMLWGLIIIIAVILSFFLARSIAKPIDEFALQLKKQNGALSLISERSKISEVVNLKRSFNDLIKEIKKLQDKAINDEKEKRHYEFKVLQSQINPHFLYNTLDAIHWKAFEHDDEEMIQIIDSLSNFYRLSLSNGAEFITIADEIKHINYYLDIQKIRFKDLFTWSIDIEPQLNDHYVIKLLLQPIVENALIHGIKPKLLPGHIMIKGYMENDDIIFNIIDDGVGMDQEELSYVCKSLEETKTKKDSFGLFNIHQRLKITYGHRYGIKIESIKGAGTKVILRLKTRREDHVESDDM